MKRKITLLSLIIILVVLGLALNNKFINEPQNPPILMSEKVESDLNNSATSTNNSENYKVTLPDNKPAINLPAQSGLPVDSGLPAQAGETPMASSSQPLKTNEENIILLNIPFTSQAPSAKWSDPKQQSGCEEASALMAVYWARNMTFTPAAAEKEIIAISDYEKKYFNNYYDTSTIDTVKRIFNGYFNFTNVQVKNINSADEIIAELEKGNAVIAPINGQTIGNPNYKRPGPLEHNLVIKGFDYNTDEFITNDSGTKKGENYRYKKDILWQSLRDYPTGKNEPIRLITKTIIIVKPEIK